MQWDKSFIEELAARRCIIFMGSGVSASCVSPDGKTRPPTWSELLKLLLKEIPNGSDKNFASECIEKKQFLEAAEIICAHINPADFASILRAQFITPKYRPSAIHESILKMDPKIVVTTNYDDIYDKFSQSGDAGAGYNVCRQYESHLINDLRSPVRSIVKAHGCVTDPSKIVLSKYQYFKARQDSPNFFKVLDALFITHTLFFVGYSLSDPDIQILLENTNITAPSVHNHYALVKKDTMHLSLKTSAMKSYNIRFVEYDSADHSDMVAGLAELAELVIEKREANPTAI